MKHTGTIRLVKGGEVPLKKLRFFPGERAIADFSRGAKSDEISFYPLETKKTTLFDKN